MIAHDLSSTFLRIMSKTTYLDDGGNEVSLVSVNQRDWTGDYPIHVAVMSKDIEALRTLIANGASVASKGERDMTALHCASLVNFPAAISVLLENGATPDSLNDTGQTAFEIAEALGHHDVLAVLNGAGDLPGTE